MVNRYAIKGTFIETPSKKGFVIQEGYLIVENGISQGIYEELPKEMLDIWIEDYSGKIIIPGISDIHLHGPQYPICGNGMDLELLEWLDTYTFPQEAKFIDKEYAKTVYQAFVKELKNSYTTRACIFGTIHQPANLILMDLLEESGLITYVGKVNMDRNSPKILIEKSAEISAKQTEEWIQIAQKHYKNTKPIITPRFIPTCTDELMKILGDLKKEYKIPYQSHLSENTSEIRWVQELCPNSESYTNAYDNLGAFGEESTTIMAHCVYLSQEEQEFLKKHQVYIAHCPDSNINLASGIAPAREYLNKDLLVGLGSDIGGGASLDMFYIIRSAIQSSKLYWRLIDQEALPLKLEEVFYMATKVGGSFFGKVGSFEKGYEVDALVLEDLKSNIGELTPVQRLEKLIYLGDYSNIYAKYIYGNRIK